MARDRVSRMTFVTTDGEKAETIFDAEGVRWEFFDTDATPAEGETPPIVTTRTVYLGDLQDGAPEDVDLAKAFALHGMKQKLSDGYAGRKESDQTAVELFDDGLAILKQGEWSEKKGGGAAAGSSSMVAAAIERVLVEDEGVEVSAEMRGRIRQSVDTPEKRKAALARPDVRLAYETIRDERRKAALEKAAQKAKEFAGPSLAESLGIESTDEA